MSKGNDKKKKPFGDISFSVIKQRGSPKEATTVDGIKVHKQDSVVCENPFDTNIPRELVKIECVDYHNEHFVYLDPVNKRGRWFAWCTCGSPSVIIAREAYKTENPMLACYFHAQFGRHVTSDGKTWT